MFHSRDSRGSGLLLTFHGSVPYNSVSLKPLHEHLILMMKCVILLTLKFFVVPVFCRLENNLLVDSPEKRKHWHILKTLISGTFPDSIVSPLRSHFLSLRTYLNNLVFPEIIV